MATTPNIGGSRRKKVDPADEFVEATAPVAAEKEPVKKLSLEVPESVHRAHKSGAALRGNTMIGEVIEMLRARNGLGPWPADVVEQVKAQIAAAEPDGPSQGARKRSA